MGIISFVGKVVLVVLNILIFFLSLALIGIGIFIIASKYVYDGLLDRFEDNLQSSLGVDLDWDTSSLTDLIIPVAYALIAIGIAVGALALLGCIGGCYALKIVLIVYVIATGVIFIAQVIIFFVVYVDKSAFDNAVKPHLRDTLKNFSGIEGTDAKTLAWNALMIFEGCCGLDSYQDFSASTSWPPSQVNGQNVDLLTPIICCRSKSTDYSCAEKGTANTSNNYMEVGCYDRLFDLIMDHDQHIIIIVFIFLALQFVLLFFSILILCKMDSNLGII